MSSSLIFSLREAYVSFGKKEIFNNLDVNIHQGDRIALIGKNGVGKSTLMKIISEKQDLDQGELWKQGGSTINYFSQQLELTEKNSIEEELMKVLSSEEEKYKIDITPYVKDDERITTSVKSEVAGEMFRLIDTGKYKKKNLIKALRDKFPEVNSGVICRLIKKNMNLRLIEIDRTYKTKPYVIKGKYFIK